MGAWAVQTFGRKKRRELLGASDGDILGINSRPVVVDTHENLIALVALTSPVLIGTWAKVQKHAVWVLAQTLSAATSLLRLSHPLLFTVPMYFPNFINSSTFLEFQVHPTVQAIYFSPSTFHTFTAASAPADAILEPPAIHATPFTPSLWAFLSSSQSPGLAKFQMKMLVSSDPLTT